MNPFVLCFTGISGSGKTTLANAVANRLEEKGIPLHVIDGDVLREDLGHLFGYTKEDRKKQTQVVKVLAKYLTQHKVNVLVSIVAPYDDIRKSMRSFLGKDFYLVYVRCPYEVCEQRDVKGYYRLVKNQQIQNLNGANDPYEAPEDADMMVDTSVSSVEDCTAYILAFLRTHGFLE